jgi:tetratricopeptide (TPR) repeat protein
MRRVSLVMSPQPKAARRAECCLLILLWFTSSYTIAMCDDASPSGGTSGRSEMPPQEQSNLARATDRAALETQAATLSVKAIQFLEGGRVEDAVVAQRQLVSVLVTMDGASHWRTKSERTLLRELERVSGLTQQQRNTYLVAYQRLLDGRLKMTANEYDKAEELLNKALDGFTMALGENFVSVATTLEKRGVIDLLRENPLKAKEYLTRAATVWKAIAGEDHPAYANALILVGAACLEAKDFKQAEVFFREALSRQRKVFGTRNSQYADLLGKLSRTMIEQKKLPEAEAICLQAISIAEETRGQDSLLMASCLFNLADVNMANEEYKDAERNLRRSLTLYERGLPSSSPVIPKVLDRYAWLLRKLDRFDEAKTIDARAQTIRGR